MPRRHLDDDDDDDYEEGDDTSVGASGARDDASDSGNVPYHRTRSTTASQSSSQAFSASQALSSSQASQESTTSRRLGAGGASAATAASTTLPPTSSAPPAASAATAPPVSAEAVAAAKALVSTLCKDKVPELKEKCKAKGISVTKKNKAELIDALVGDAYPGVDVSAIDLATRPTVRVTHQAGGSRAGWRLLQPTGQSRLVTLDAYLTAMGPRIGESLERIVRNASALLRETSSLYPNVTTRLGTFLGFTRGLSELVVKQSRAAAGTNTALRFNGVHLLHALGAYFVTNVSSLPLEEKWPSAAPSDFTKEVFLRVLHNVTAYGARPASRDESRTAWAAPEDAHLPWEEVCKAFQDDVVGFLAGCILRATLDDDLINYAGVMPYSVPKTIIQHEGEGATIDAVVAFEFGFVICALLRKSGGGELVRRVLAHVDKKIVASLTFDRWYTRVTGAEEVAARGVATLGTLQDKLGSQQPFSLTDFNKSDVATLESHLSAVERTAFDLCSFPGCGPGATGAVNGKGVAVFAVNDRRSRGSKPGVIRLVTTAAGARRDDGSLDPVAGAAWELKMREKLTTWVAIPRAEGRDTAATLAAAARKNDVGATRIAQHINSSGSVMLTETQGDAGWYGYRTTCMTAMAANIAVPAFLASAASGAHARVTRLVFGASKAPEEIPQDELVRDAEEQVAARAEVEARLREGAARASEGAGATPGVDADVDADEEEVGAHAVRDADEGETEEIEVEEDVGVASSTGASSTGASSAGAASSTSVVPPGLAKALETQARVLKQQVLTSFSGNDATVQGHVGETRADKFVLDVPAVSRLYKGGLVSITTMRYAASSPDQWLLVDTDAVKAAAAGQAPPQRDDGYVPDIVLGEVKYSKHHSHDLIAVTRPIYVKAGTSEYEALVPRKWRIQLLHQLATSDLRYVLLVFVAPAGPSSIILIEYTADDIAAYRAMLNEPFFMLVFPLWAAPVTETTTDAEFVGRVSPHAKKVIRSVLYAHGQRALMLERFRLGQSNLMVPAIHAIRNALLQDYQVSKAGVDSVEMIIADAVRPGARTVLLGVESKITLRYFYFAAYNAWRVIGLTTFYEKEIATIADPNARRDALRALSLKEVRARANKCVGTFPSFVHALGADMLRRRIPLGSYSVGALEAAPVAFSAAATPAHPSAPDFLPMGAHPKEVRAYVKRRARQQNREVGAVDFLTGTWLALDDGTFSPSTPGSLAVMSPYFEARAKQLVEAFSSRPPASVYRPTRITFWENVGRSLRLGAMLAHPVVSVTTEESSKSATCSWCGESKRLKERRACALCGEDFCGDACFNAFHATAEFPEPPKASSAKGAAGSTASGSGAEAAGSAAAAGGASASAGALPLNLGASSDDDADDDADDASALPRGGSSGARRSAAAATSTATRGPKRGRRG